MGVIKISELTEKTTPAGTEELVIADGSTSKRIKISNLATFNVNTATTHPSATDDNYPVGTIWVNTTAGYVWICEDNTASTAVWKVVNPPIYGG